MADELTPTGSDDPDYAAHLETYEGFIKGIVMACLAAAFVMVALVMFGFGKSAAVFLGFLGMVAGMVAIGIDVMSARGGGCSPSPPSCCSCWSPPSTSPENIGSAHENRCSAEQAPGEARVAVSPETIKAYVRKGVDVAVETGAGRGSFIPDAQLAAAGATIAPSAEAALRDADIVLTVQAPRRGDACRPAERCSGRRPDGPVRRPRRHELSPPLVPASSPWS